MVVLVRACAVTQPPCTHVWTLPTAFAASVWINDAFIDTISAITAAGDANATFVFPNGSVVPGQDNVVTVLQDHMGNDEGSNRASICSLCCVSSR